MDYRKLTREQRDEIEVARDGMGGAADVVGRHLGRADESMYYQVLDGLTALVEAHDGARDALAGREKRQDLGPAYEDAYDEALRRRAADGAVESEEAFTASCVACGETAEPEGRTREEALRRLNDGSCDGYGGWKVYESGPRVQVFCPRHDILEDG